jgi:hypothetical protein
MRVFQAVCAAGGAFRTASAQCSAQAPGPSGWPQLPQGPAIAGADCADCAADGPVANTDNCFSSAVDWQLGHWGTVLDRTRASNAWPQSLQAYS